MLLTVDLCEDFIDNEYVAVSSLLSLQTTRIFGTKFDTPQPDRFATDSDTMLGDEIFDISVTWLYLVEPDGMRNDVRRKSVSFISVHTPILTVMSV